MARKSRRVANFPSDFIGKFINDEEFRKKILAKAAKLDPPEGFALQGFKLSKRQVETIRNVDAAVVDRAVELLKKSGGGVEAF